MEIIKYKRKITGTANHNAFSNIHAIIMARDKIIKTYFKEFFLNERPMNLIAKKLWLETIK
jgi:hypothetical protein